MDEDLSPADFDENQLEEQAVDFSATVVEDLVRIRKHHGLTVAEVAERMGVSEQSVLDFEDPYSDPYSSTVRRYCLAVGAMLSWAVS